MEAYLISDGCRWPLSVSDSGERACLDKAVCECGEVGVAGTGIQYSNDGMRYEATGCCSRCKKVLGRIVVETNSIFGAREDDSVLSGRCRVY